MTHTYLGITAASHGDGDDSEKAQDTNKHSDGKLDWLWDRADTWADLAPDPFNKSLFLKDVPGSNWG